MEEEFVLINDYTTDDGKFYLNQGERVKVLQTDDNDPTLLLVQAYDEASRRGLVPMDYLKKIAPSRTHTPDSLGHSQKSRKQEAKFNREVCIGELIETEEEFGKDIQRVVEQYLTPLEEEIRPAPRTVMDNKDTIFNNLRQISSFHNGIMISGVKYFLKEPKTIGRTLLRLERDFDKHAEYVKNEPAAQELLATNDEIRDYFEDLSQEIGDDKTLADHLKLPIQRINDYTLLLQELIKYSRILGEDITDLERALELMLWIPTRCGDLKFITNIEGYHGNIHKLGRLIRHNWFLIKDKTGGKGKERYCFLFKARLLICKVRRISEDRCVFVLKEIIKLPEVDFRNRSDKRTFDIHCTEPNCGNFPYTFIAHEDDVKSDWLREIQEHSEEDLTQAEHIADDLKLNQSQSEDDLFEPLKGVELDISPDIEESLGPIENPGHRPLKHVPEPKRPPLEIPKKRAPIFTCVDPTPSPSPEREPTPEPSQEDMYSSFRYEEVTVQEEVYVETFEEPEDVEDEVEELIEMPTGKRKPKYIPGVSKPLFHSTIRGSSNERTELFDQEYCWWKYTHRRSSDFNRKTEFESSVTAGENAVFECEVEGVSKMTWLKDNRPLSDRLADRIAVTEENNIYRLEIKNITESDSGTYTARAENDCGVSFSTAHLIVEKLSDEERRARAKATSPVFLVQLKDAELLESTHARFIVRVNGTPVPQVEFYKGDKLISSDDERIQIIQDKDHPGFYELVIPEVKPEDAGEYRCVASNKYSDESCSCLVTVTNEKDLFAGLEEDVSPGAPRFSWLKNGKPFTPEERFKVIYKDEEDSIALVFQNVKPEDAGLYTCVASTSHGKISCSAELTVQGTVKELEKLPKKPQIESITTDFEGNVASTGVLEVKVTADPLPSVRWFKDGEEITASGRYKTLYDEETEAASLVIKNLSLEDSGEYNIIARNEVGTASQFVNLHVKAPPRITKKLEDFTGLTGKELRLTIQVNASPKPIVQWYKDGLMLKKSNRIKYEIDESSESYTLVIENAVMDDAGTYSVVASNEFSQVSDVCHISMESPPQFVGTITKEVETLEGDYVSFSVMVEGDPLPKVIWKFNGKEIVSDGKHFKTSSEGAVFTLLISEVKREDAGSYTCEICNQWGSNECDGQLFVKCLPRFDKELENLQVNESDVDVEFTVKLNAFPKATVTWYHDEAEITSKKKEYTCIEDGDTYKLIIKQATTKLSGTYKCKAENDVGYKETTATLSVYTFPVFKKELSDVDITEGETLRLTVQCQGVPEPDVKWYKNGEEIYSDSRIKITRDAKRIENYNLTITLVQSEDGGEYEVRASNERGTAVTKSLITVLASTDHKKPVIDEEVEVMVNGDSKDDESEKVPDGSKSSTQVKDKVTIKLPPRKKVVEPNEASKKDETCEKPPFRKRLSTESGDEDGFTVRELRSEELTAATELRASHFGLVEEPPENEHYIKINISRGVSIVSVSEDETNDDQTSQLFDESTHLPTKKNKNIFELNEEDELNLELNEDIEVFTDDGAQMNSFFQKQSKMNENVMNAINKHLSSLEDGNDANVVSYNSLRKSSIIEESEKPQKTRTSQLEKSDQKDSVVDRKSSLRVNSVDESPKKMTKVVSFDEQPTRVIESDNTDEAVEELFKRIQTQRNILGEILEKQNLTNEKIDDETKMSEIKSNQGRKLSLEIVTDVAIEEPITVHVIKIDDKRQRAESVDLTATLDINSGKMKPKDSDALCENQSFTQRRKFSSRTDSGDKEVETSHSQQKNSAKSKTTELSESGDFTIRRRVSSHSSSSESQTKSVTIRRGNHFGTDAIDVSEVVEIEMQNDGEAKHSDYLDQIDKRGERRRVSLVKSTDNEEIIAKDNKRESNSDQTVTTSIMKCRENQYESGSADVSEVVEIEVQNDNIMKAGSLSDQQVETREIRRRSLLRSADSEESTANDGVRKNSSSQLVSTSIKKPGYNEFGTDAANVSETVEVEVQKDGSASVDVLLGEKVETCEIKRFSKLKNVDEDETFSVNRRQSTGLNEASTVDLSIMVQQKCQYNVESINEAAVVEVESQHNICKKTDTESNQEKDTQKTKRRTVLKSLNEDEDITKERRRGSHLTEEVFDITGSVDVSAKKLKDHEVSISLDSDVEKICESRRMSSKITIDQSTSADTPNKQHLKWSTDSADTIVNNKSGSLKLGESSMSIEETKRFSRLSSQVSIDETRNLTLENQRGKTDVQNKLVKADSEEKAIRRRYSSQKSIEEIGSCRGSQVMKDVCVSNVTGVVPDSNIPESTDKHRLQHWSSQLEGDEPKSVDISSQRGNQWKGDSVDQTKVKNVSVENDMDTLDSVGVKDNANAITNSRRGSQYSLFKTTNDSSKPESALIAGLRRPSLRNSVEKPATSSIDSIQGSHLRTDSTDTLDETPTRGSTQKDKELNRLGSVEREPLLAQRSIDKPEDEIPIRRRVGSKSVEKDTTPNYTRRFSAPSDVEEPNKTIGSRQGSQLKSYLDDINEVSDLKHDADNEALNLVTKEISTLAPIPSQRSIDEPKDLSPTSRGGSCLAPETFVENAEVKTGADKSKVAEKYPLSSQSSVNEPSIILSSRRESVAIMESIQDQVHRGVENYTEVADVGKKEESSRLISQEKTDDLSSEGISHKGNNLKANKDKLQDNGMKLLYTDTDALKSLSVQTSIDDVKKPLPENGRKSQFKDELISATDEDMVTKPTDRTFVNSRLSSLNSTDEPLMLVENTLRKSLVKDKSVDNVEGYDDNINAMIESVNKTLSRLSSRNSVDESSKQSVHDRRSSAFGANLLDKCEKRDEELPIDEAKRHISSQKSVDADLKTSTIHSRRGSRFRGDLFDTFDSVTEKPEQPSEFVDENKHFSRRSSVVKPEKELTQSRRASIIAQDSINQNEPSSKAFSRLSSQNSKDSFSKVVNDNPKEYFDKSYSPDLSSADKLNLFPLSNKEGSKTDVEIREPQTSTRDDSQPPNVNAKNVDELNDHKLNDNSGKLLKKPSMRSATLDSISDLSFDDDKGSFSKRGSLVVDAKSGEKGEFPKILSGMDQDIETFESLSTSFEVQGYGVPRPSVIWFKDGEEIQESKHFVMIEDGDKYKLEILDLNACDAGVYTAKLVNSVGETSKEAKLIIQNVENLRGPKLKEPLKNKIIVQKQKAVLEATFIADPVPDAKWTVDNNDANADFTVDVKELDLGLKECNYIMTIPSTELSDTGNYKVKVKNKFDSAESSASLTIVMKPEIEVFKDLVVPPTMPCTFEVFVKSTPEAEVSWYVNGQKIISGSKHKISSEKIDEFKTLHRLSLEDCQLSDEGEYKIEAENNVGKCDAVATLKLYTEKPSFLKLLEDRTVQDYDLLQMKVRVNGLPTPELKWYRNGQEIISNDHLKIDIWESGQVSTMLSIDHFTKDDVAEFKVVAKNIVGEAETSAKLTLAQIEPSFIEPLKRVTEVSEGQPLDISTKVIGSPIPSVQWFKDGEEIKPDDERIKILAAPDGALKLSIDKVDIHDCGAYKAVAANDLGKSIANTAVVVDKAPKKPSFIKKLEDIIVVEGQPIKLEIQIDGFPEPSVKWLKDGHPLHPCPQMDFVCGPNNIYGLTIEKASLQDLGQYSAIISNKSGEASSSGHVSVNPSDKAPVFQTQLQPVKVVEGYPAKLEVKVDGFPLPKLTWYFNGNPLKIDNENIKLGTTPDGNHCLLIEKVTPKNSGEYEVVAKNDNGDNSSKARLTVSSRSNSKIEPEKPVFLHGLRDVTVDESGELSISAPFRGNPIPDVQWFKDGSLLLPNERIHFTCDGYKVGLQIQDVNMGDTGFYSCALKNPYGEDSTAGHIGVRKLYQAPVFTQRFRHIQQLPTHDAKFHCRVTGVPFPSIIWHRNGVPISNSDKYQIKRDGDVCCLTVFNVNHDDEATYSCIASNRDGTATCEAQLQVVDKVDTAPKQEAPQFMKKIGDCEIYPGMTAKFTACASGYPEPEYEWFCDTVRLHPSNRTEMEKEGTGLVRLNILCANPDIDRGRYRLRAFNPHGEAFCEANLVFDDGLETKYKRPVGELYKDYDRFRATGAPLPLADKPIICCMTDRHLTLSWKPSIPIGPREPVTYLVEMEEQPNGKWFTARSGLRSCICDIHNLKPFVDYKFRIRVENNYGISDPSPFAVTYREKLEPDPPKIRTHLPPNVPFHPDASHYFPKDFDIERPPHDNYAQAPRFLRQEYDAQYGVKGHNVNLFWFVYGYPKPKISFYFNDELIEMGGRYDCSYTRNGQATLFINKMMDRDVGVYEAVAVNEHGMARQRVQLKIAEYPEFLKRPSESWVPLRKTCRLEARVIGVPYPEIKWYKDWKPLASSSRIQIERVEPDICILRISDVIMKDEGLYSISARNIAGSISTSVYLHVEENDYDTIVGGKRGSVLIRNKRFDDIYDLGDELGRGTQGITFHAVERNTGKNLAAKVMHGDGELRKWMNNELDIMNHLNHRNIIRPYDSLISSKSFTIIQELASGGELLDILTRKTFISEYEISKYIRQLLLALDYMHEFNIGHLGLTPGDLLISHPGGDHLKLCDFGLSRRINSRKLEPLYFGMPEFVAPEVANGEGVNLSADMWSVGIITHLLLTGVSLFRGKDDVDTLDRIKESRFSVNTDISEDARDFIIKLLMINPNNRLDVRAALNHRWIRLSESTNPPPADRQINTENLRNYYNLYKDWYSNCSCRTWFRRRPLESAYNDPSRMVYPPGRSYSPAPTPERSSEKEMNQHKSWKDQIPSREQLDADIGLIKSESHYQYGPDTYLLQLRDVNFPVRLREYMKVARKSTSEGFDWQAPVIRERRRFMDVMDEEIEDEQKARINKYGSADIYTLRRLKQEIGARPTAHVEAEAILGSRIDGLPPFFREKPQFLPVEIGKPAELICYAVGSPKPLVQWFKNDLVLTESNRVKITEDNDGRSILRLDPASDWDLGIYKVVARNKFGQTTARTRLAPAAEPSPPEAPEIVSVSDTEVLLKWKQPKDDGNSSVLCYGLQYQENDDCKWNFIAENIDQEAWLVHDLKPSVSYQFRLLAMNKIGWSIPGFPSNNVITKLPGAEKIIVPHVLRSMQLACEKGKQIIGDEPRTVPDYSLEYQPLQWEEQPPEDKYRFISEIARGRYSIIVKAMNSADRKLVVAKLMETNATTELEINHEFDILKTMRHERIAYLIEAFKLQFSSVAIFIMEKLQGSDILTYLTSRHTYSEQMVATIITQILDGLQYLHWRGYCHLNLQLDNIAMSSVRSLQVKLIDFSCAQRVNRLGSVVPNKGLIEYTAPEILCDEPAYPYSDVWSVGVLTYILLSGVSPFKGTSELETRQNITFVRYRFEHLYKDLSQEALRFLMLLFKRTPGKRPSAEECHEHRWLLPTEYMIKKREKTHFDTAKLKIFSKDYHSQRESVATKSKEILSVLGGRVQRSNSIIEELEVSSTAALH